MPAPYKLARSVTQYINEGDAKRNNHTSCYLMTVISSFSTRGLGVEHGTHSTNGHTCSSKLLRFPDCRSVTLSMVLECTEMNLIRDESPFIAPINCREKETERARELKKH